MNLQIKVLAVFDRFNSTFTLCEGCDFFCLSIVKKVNDKKCRTLYITHSLAKYLEKKYKPQQIK